MFMHPYISHEIARARQRDLLEDAAGSAWPDGCAPGQGRSVATVAGPWSRRWPRRPLWCWSWSWLGAAETTAA